MKTSDPNIWLEHLRSKSNTYKEEEVKPKYLDSGITFSRN